MAIGWPWRVAQEAHEARTGEALDRMAQRMAAMEQGAERMEQAVAKCVLAAELAQRSEARMRSQLQQAGGGAWGVGDGRRVGLDNDIDTLDTP